MFQEAINYETHEPRTSELVARTQAALLAKIATAKSVSYIELVSLPIDDDTRVPYDVIDTALINLVHSGLVVKSYEPTREGNALVTYEPVAQSTNH